MRGDTSVARLHQILQVAFCRGALNLRGWNAISRGPGFSAGPAQRSQSSSHRGPDEGHILHLALLGALDVGDLVVVEPPHGSVRVWHRKSADLSIKQLELLKEAVPRLSRVALLWNPGNPWHPATVRALQASSGSLGLRLQVLEARGPEAFDGVFHAMTTASAQAVLVLVDPMTR